MRKVEFTATAHPAARIILFPFLAFFAALDATDPAHTSWLLRLLFYPIFGGVCLGAQGTLLDRSSGSAVTWWGLNFPLLLNIRLLRKRKPLAPYSEVELRRVTLSTKGRPYDVYRLLLAGKAAELLLYEFSSREKARTRCLEAAKYLGFGMLDRSGSSPERRSAQELDDSLRDHRLRRPCKIVLPELPVAPVMRTETTQDGLRVRIPACGCKPQHWAGLLIASASAWVLWWAAGRFSWLDPVAAPPLLICILFSSIFMLGGAYAWLRSALVRDELLISTEGVRLTRRLLFLFFTRSMPADDIQHLEVGSEVVPGLLAQDRIALKVFGRGKTFAFGYGLSRLELDWLERAITDYVGA